MLRPCMDGRRRATWQCHLPSRALISCPQGCDPAAAVAACGCLVLPTGRAAFLSQLSFCHPARPQVFRHGAGGYWRASKRWCKTLPAELVDKALHSFAHNGGRKAWNSSFAPLFPERLLCA